jgi:hypothetical protein
MDTFMLDSVKPYKEAMHSTLRSLTQDQEESHQNRRPATADAKSRFFRDHPLETITEKKPTPKFAKNVIPPKTTPSRPKELAKAPASPVNQRINVLR